MTRLTAPRIPSYRLHKPSGLAVVRLNGRDHYLGRYATAESKREYEQLIAEWLVCHRQIPTSTNDTAPASDITVDELIAAYWEHAQSYYVKHGRPTSTQQHIRDVLRPLHLRYGDQPANSIGPLRLKTLRQHMIDENRWCRDQINKAIGIIKRVFKWGVENELVSAESYHRLAAITGLRRGRGQGRESEPVTPVPDADIVAVSPHISQQVRTMIELQRLTGMRPSEVVSMRGFDLDTTGKLWTYTPTTHKTEHHDRRRTIHIGPRAQTILKRWLKADLQGYLFSPADAEMARRATRRLNRQSPMTPSQTTRRPKANPRRTPLDCYTTASYRRAIHRACDIAFPPPEPLAKRGNETYEQWQLRLTTEQKRQLAEWQQQHRWSPNQLRHTAATYLRKQFGIEAARVVLGHSSAAITEVYAELDQAKAADVMAKVG